MSAFKCSEAPRGLSAERAPARPLAACAGLCRQLLTKRMPAPASLREVKPNQGSETAQAALLMLQELKHKQRFTTVKYCMVMARPGVARARSSWLG